MNRLVENYLKIKSELPENVTLVAVSKTKPTEMIQTLYDAGVRDFGENKVQELCDKQLVLPNDINWHQIGHLQTNKVKYIAPFIYLVHAVDSEKLLIEINKRAQNFDRIQDLLLQIHIAEEDSKFGLDEAELFNLIEKLETNIFQYVNIRGLMGMATFTDDEIKIAKEFRGLRKLYEKVLQQSSFKEFNILSMGMSGDYKIAIAEGSNMVRLGSSIFGERN